MKKLLPIIILLAPFTSSSQCSAPSNINLLNNIPLLNSVELSWSENGTATMWEIAMVPNFNVGTPLPTDSWIAASNNPFTISGIPSSYECYAFFVRSVCSSTDVSSWSAVGSLGCSVAAYNWLLTLSTDSFTLNPDNENIQIFPNPTTSVAYVVNYSELIKVTVYDSLGKQVLTQSQIVDEINVEDLPSGIYLIEIITGEGKLHKKLIKQ
jgi:hypothetical protein